MPHLLFPKHWLTLAGVGAAIVNALFRVLLIPLLLTPLVDKVLIQQEMALLPRLLVWAGAAVLLGSLALWLQDGCLGHLAAWVLQRWRAGLYQHWLEPHPSLDSSLDSSQAEAFSSGGFSSRVLADLKEVEIFLQYGIGSLLAESLTLIGILAVLFYLHASATITLLLSLIPVVLLMMWTGRALQRHSHATQAGLESLGAHLQEGFSRRTLLQIFQAQAFALQRFDAHNQQTYQQQQRRVWLAALQTPLAQLLGFVALLVLLGRLLTSDLSAGELMSYLTLLALLSTPAQLLPRAYGYLQMARAAAKRLYTLYQPELFPSYDDIPIEGIQSLRLDGVSFAYDAQVILDTVSLELRAPSFVLLIGESGAGKSTVLQLLLQLLEPSQGAIYFDAMSPLSPQQRAQHIGYVPQTPQLFQASIADNLRLGRDIPEAALWQVLAQVGLQAAIVALPQGLATPLQEATSTAQVGLSVGQQQRLSLARALLHQPNILLLDEANANLDASSERQMLEVLRAYAQQHLVIMVSHRPLALDYADVVYRLEAGTLLREK